MMVCLVVRTLFAAAWLGALVAHAEPGAGTGLLALAIALVWAAPLLRDRHRPAGGPRRQVLPRG
jgi:hypothetical protein